MEICRANRKGNVGFQERATYLRHPILNQILFRNPIPQQNISSLILLIAVKEVSRLVLASNNYQLTMQFLALSLVVQRTNTRNKDLIMDFAKSIILTSEDCVSTTELPEQLQKDVAKEKEQNQ
jgi:hypothetical protein